MTYVDSIKVGTNEIIKHFAVWFLVRIRYIVGRIEVPKG